MRWAGILLSAVPGAAIVLLCGCAPDAVQDEDRPADPAMSKALDEQIMIDPDLVDQNMASSAINISSPDGSLPTNETGPQALADARAAALIEIGGPGKMLKAPEPASEGLPAGAGAAAASKCAVEAEDTMQWAARMPPAFPVYPHGAVQQASGTDASGTDALDCALRIITFITPVPGGEVIDYYYTRAMRAGFSAHRVRDGEEDILSGDKGSAAYKLSVKDAGSGATKVELVTRGF